MIHVLTNLNCNLYCAYCFEKHLWQKKDKLTPDELKYILKFIDRKEEVLLSGGEPTLHPQFQELLTILQNHENKACLLSNGLFHHNLQEEIIKTFKLVLINIHDPRKYSEENWKILQNNIEAIAIKDSSCMLQLGVNIYEPNQRFEYLIPFLKFFHIIKELRISFVQPNYCFTNQSLNLEQMKAMVLAFLNVISLAVSFNFSVSLDCPIPPCIFTTEQLEFISQYSSDVRFGDCAGNFTFYPGLKIGHCFASFPNLYDLHQFNSLIQIEEYIRAKEDPILFNIPSFKECESCLFRNNQTCQGGCMAFKMPKILKPNG